jgi:hypothetical protein
MTARYEIHRVALANGWKALLTEEAHTTYNRGPANLDIYYKTNGSVNHLRIANKDGVEYPETGKRRAALKALSEPTKKKPLVVQADPVTEYEVEYEVVWTAGKENHTYLADDEVDARAYAEYLQKTQRGTGIRARSRKVALGPWKDL